MYLIVGLGNPGEEYAHTRHNAGFDALDLIADALGVTYWKQECGAYTAKGSWNGEDVVLAKPQSFMNASGGPVKRLMNAYNVPADHVIIIHDDLDLVPGSIRVRFGGGHAGHNGLKSINEKTGTLDWYRVRIGIGHPPGRMDTVRYVLSQPRGDEANDITDAIDRAAESTLYLIEHGLQDTQQEFN